jgi:2-dehydropantoate 2-reductase
MNGIPWWYFHAHGGPHDGRRLSRLDPDDALWRTIGPQRAIGGVFWPACSTPEPGVVRLLTGAGRGTVFGEPDGRTTPRIEALAAAFGAAKLPVTIAPDIRQLIWQKLVFNLSAGPMCVLTQSPVRATHEEAALIECSRRAVAEAEAIAAAMGHDPEIEIERVVAANMQLAHRPSILQDLEAGRPMEIDALYSVPLEMARMTGVATPTLDLLVAMIMVKARAAGLYSG